MKRLLLILILLMTGVSASEAKFFSGGAPPTFEQMPNVASAPIGVYSTYWLLGNYSGPLFRIVKTGGAVLDIFPNANGSPNISGVAAFLGAATSAQVSIWYDQSGNGNNATQTVAGTRPLFSLTNAVNGTYSITYNSASTYFNIPSSLTGSGRNYTVIDIANMEASSIGGLSLEGSAYSVSGAMGIINGNVPTNKLNILSSIPPSGAFEAAGTARSRSQTQVIVASSNASNIIAYQDSLSFTLGPNGSGTWVGGLIGQGYAGNSYVGEYYGHIVYPTALSSGDVGTLQTYLNSTFKVITSANAQVIWPGNSITEGTSATLLNNNQRQMEPQLSRQIFIANQGRFGQLASQEFSDRASYTGQFRGDLTFNLMIAPEGTNDLNGRASGSIVGYGTTIYNSYILPFVQAAQTAGFTVIVPTMLPRAWSGSATDISQKQTEWAAYNALVKGNAVADGYSVADFAGIAQMANPADTTYYADGTHPTSTGYGLMATLLAGIINGLI